MAFPLAAVALALSVTGQTYGRVAVALLFVASVAHLRLAFLPGPSVSRALLLVPALLAAAVLLCSPPLLSDDVYRYLFDGACVSDGLSPFAHAPGSSKVADLVAVLPGRVNHPHLPTIYPPAAQGLFGILSALGLGVTAWKASLVVALAAGAAVCSTLRPTLGASGTGPWVFGHPLAILTAAGNGNVDVVGILILALALQAAIARRHVAVGFFLALGGAVKLFPIGLWMALLGRHGLRRSILVVALTLGGLAVAYAPFASSGLKAFGSLAAYAESWEYNGSAHPLLTAGLDGALEASGIDESINLGASDSLTYYDGEPTFDRWVSRRELASGAAKGVGLLALLAVAGFAWRRRLDFADSAVLVLATLFLFSAVVHPWYLLWLLVPSVVSGHRAALGWCATATLAFWAPALVLDGYGWVEPFLVRALEYAVPAILAMNIGASLTGRHARAYSR